VPWSLSSPPSLAARPSSLRLDYAAGAAASVAKPSDRQPISCHTTGETIDGRLRAIGPQSENDQMHKGVTHPTSSRIDPATHPEVAQECVAMRDQRFAADFGVVVFGARAVPSGAFGKGALRRHRLGAQRRRETPDRERADLVRLRVRSCRHSDQIDCGDQRVSYRSTDRRSRSNGRTFSNLLLPLYLGHKTDLDHWVRFIAPYELMSSAPTRVTRHELPSG